MADDRRPRGGEQGTSDPSRQSPRDAAARRRIADLRMRLLDLTNANRLLNYKFSERSRRQARFVDEAPDELLRRLEDGKRLVFRSLPEPNDEPADEKEDAFLLALEQAKRSEDQYLSELGGLGEDEDGELGRRAERALRDRLRRMLGMPERLLRDQVSKADWARRNGIEPAFDLPAPDPAAEGNPAHTDGYVQTLLFPLEMERLLSAICDLTRTTLQETGVNTLYLALGFLQWRETPDVQASMLAPLLLHPIDMDRKIVAGTYRYSLGSLGDDTEINITLSERLHRDFHRRLPELNPEDTAEAYFEKVTVAIEGLPGWKVRRFGVVGHFAFARLVMYHDLEDVLWGDGQGVISNSVISQLFAGGNSGSEAFFSPEYPVDEPHIAAKVPLLITDADSSQFSAIVDVMDGKNLAVKGPPGTGKSQTITNVIAAALASDKRVLFVAEKMAALNVVKDRLEKAGLGQFCLELHSTKARKKALLESLQARLAIQGRLPAAGGISLALKELQRLRDQLSGYVGMINRPFGASGKTIHGILWAEQQARHAHQDLPRAVDEIDLHGAKQITPYDVETLRDSLTAAATAHADAATFCGDIASHPWQGVCNPDLDHFGRERLIASMTTFRASLGTLEDVLLRIAKETGSPVPSRIDGAIDLAGVLEHLPGPAPELDGDLFASMRDSTAFEAIATLEAELTAWFVADRELSTLVSDPEAVSSARGELDSLTHIVREWALSGQPLSSLPDEARALDSRRARIERTISCSRRLATAFGVVDALTASSVRHLITATKQAASLAHDLYALRHPGLFDESATATLEDGHARARSLKDKLGRLSSRVSVSLDGPAEVWRAHARVLRSVTFLSALWRRDVRAAKQAYRARLRSARRPARLAMAADFEAMAECVDLATGLATDEALQAVCGRHFRGPGTPFAKLLAVNSFGTAVRSAFPPDGGVRTHLGRRLLEAPSEELAAITLLAQDPDLGTATESLASFTHGDSDIVEHYDALGFRARSIATLAQRTRELGFGHGLLAEAVPRVRDLAAARVAAQTAIATNERARQLMGSRWRGERSDATVVAKAVAAARSIEEANLPRPLREHLYHPERDGRLGRLMVLRGSLVQALDAAMQRWDEIRALATIDEASLGLSVPACDLSAATRRIDYALTAPEELSVWTSWLRARQTCVDTGLAEILGAFKGELLDGARLSAALSRVLWRALARAALSEHPALDRFRGIDLQKARDRFRQLDEEVISLQRKALASTLCDRKIEPGHRGDLRKDDTGLVLVRHEAGKQKRHIALRELLDRAGPSISQMKPCFMMSPLSVAQFLKPSGLRFDLVVIDEASQMRPEEALGAVARGGQLVVVGDPMQLPPTSFFDRVDRDLTDDELDESEIVDNESILDLALAEFRPARSLRWHYRSRHESLIAFSNREFYDDLIVFPSPLDPERDKREPRLGVYHRFVGGKYQGRVNIQEAQAVAEEAVAFMAAQPDKSLGIVTLNQPQRDLLLEEMERAVAREGWAQRYIERWEGTLEPFFVKNLENVQGDERDVIFISTVYGPDSATGVVMNRFGPINGVYGHRRLNVLFTRAKDRVEVYTSMRADDIKATESSQPGLWTLKRYLEYAETGRLESGTPSDREPDSEFEQLVRDRLRERGLEVVPQLGVAGYYIDLAVKHPHRSGYLLGIECDGAAYHSSLSARDRDRLRQKVLEGLQWQIYRIWSTDWFRNPEVELRRLLAHIDKLLERVPDPAPAAPSPETVFAPMPPAQPWAQRPSAVAPERDQGNVKAAVPVGSAPPTAQKSGPPPAVGHPRVAPQERRQVLAAHLGRQLATEDRVCSSCGRELAVEITSGGPFLRCAGASCQRNRRIMPSVVYAAIREAHLPCPCGGTLVLRGPQSGFLGCTNYPTCRSPISWRDL